ncbi:MAG: Vitamin B12-binding protein precursor [Planctomycetota bacterium]
MTLSVRATLSAVAMAVVMAVVALLPAACGRSAPEPPPAPDATPRIVVLSPAVASVVRELGHGDRIVGRHAFDSFLPASIPSCGDQAGIDYETLLTLRPTHVLTQWGSRDLPPRLVDLAQERGWRLSDHPMLSLGDIRRCVDAVGQALLPADPDGRVAALRRRMDEAWSPRAGLPAGRVLLLASISSPAAFGPGSCHQEVLEAIGATPALAAGGAFVSLDHEDITKLKPDLFILLLPGAGDPAGPSVVTLDHAARGTPLLPGMTPANTRVIVDPECQIPGVAMIRLADHLDAAIRQASGMSPR